jgi:hypothetical protein
MSGPDAAPDRDFPKFVQEQVDKAIADITAVR